MELNIQKIITPYNRTVYTDRTIKYLVFHYTGTLAPAVNNAKYYASQYVGASAHYYLDETPVIYQGVEEKDASWHCGTTNPALYKGDCRNANSIGVEMVPKKRSTETMLATDEDWYFAPETIENALALGRDIMARHGISIENVIRHYDVTGKICPNPFVVNAEAQAAWADFKKRLEEPDMTRDEVLEIVNEAIAAANKVYVTVDDVPAWAKPAVTRYVEAGVLHGNEHGDLNLTVDLLRALVVIDRLEPMENDAVNDE